MARCLLVLSGAFALATIFVPLMYAPHVVLFPFDHKDRFAGLTRALSAWEYCRFESMLGAGIVVLTVVPFVLDRGGQGRALVTVGIVYLMACVCAVAYDQLFSPVAVFHTQGLFPPLASTFGLFAAAWLRRERAAPTFTLRFVLFFVALCAVAIPASDFLASRQTERLTTLDGTFGVTECPVHHQTLLTEIKTVWHEHVHYTAKYQREFSWELKSFPYAKTGEYYDAYVPHTKVKIGYCEACRKAKREWHSGQ